jgi:hypothetical protein
MVSLYGQYIAERQGRGIVENEFGFATFDYISDKIVYIVDLYVVPEKRNTHVATELADKICEEAVKSGHTQLLGSIDVTARGAEASVKVLEAYGMKPYKVAEPMVFYIKQIADEAIEAEVV